MRPDEEIRQAPNSSSIVLSFPLHKLNLDSVGQISDDIYHVAFLLFIPDAKEAVMGIH